MTITRAQCRCGRPVNGATLCRQCTRDLARNLGDIPALAEELVTTYARLDRVGGDNAGRRSSARPLPWNDAASVVLADLRSTMVGWVRELEAGEWPADTIPAMAAWLLSRVDRIRVHPAGDEAADEIAVASDRARQAIDIAPRRIYAGPCGEKVADSGSVRHGDGSRCEGHARGGSRCTAGLYGHPGDATVTCRCCGAEHGLEDRRETMKADLDAMLCTGAEIAGFAVYFGDTQNRERVRNLIKRWGDRGVIAPHSVDYAGRPLYRFGEVLARLLKSEQRKAS